MSTRPVQMPVSPQMRKEEDLRKKERAAKRSDLLYFSGAATVTAGLCMFRIRDGVIAAGCFLLLLPLLELAGSFIRGLRPQAPRR